MNYVIIQVSGKQYIVKPGRWYNIDFLSNSAINDILFIQKILLIKSNNKIQIGKPFLTNAVLPVRIIAQPKGNKLNVLKTKPKKGYTRTLGHRSKYTRIFINNF